MDKPKKSGLRKNKTGEAAFEAVEAEVAPAAVPAVAEPPPFSLIKQPSADEGPELSLKDLSPERLLAMRAQIDRALPPALLKDMNLEEELVRQFQSVKALQLDIITDKDTPSNQKAQVANTCAATLSQLTKMQAEFYTSERFKTIEGILIKCLKTLPEDVVQLFFNEYEAMNT